MKYFFISFLLLFSFFSCKKRGKADFVLRGVITDATFNAPLSGTEIQLYEVSAGSGTAKLIGTKNTGVDGSYSFKFKRNNVESYILKVQKAQYFNIDETIYFSSMTIEEDNVRNYSTTAKSWVKLKFINNTPNAGDILKYTISEGKTGCSECCAHQEVQIIDGTIDSTYCITDGNTIFKYNYQSFPSNDVGIKSITTIPFDTVDLILNY